MGFSKNTRAYWALVRAQAIAPLVMFVLACICGPGGDLRARASPLPAQEPQAVQSPQQLTEPPSAPVLKPDLMAHGKIDHSQSLSAQRWSTSDGRYVYLESIQFVSVAYAVDYEKDHLGNPHQKILERTGSPSESEERILIHNLPHLGKKETFSIVRRTGSNYIQISSEFLELVRALEQQILNEPPLPKYVIPDSWMPRPEDYENADREAHKPPGNLFKVVGKSDGMDTDGVLLDVTEYKASDGTRVTLSYSRFKDAGAANKHLDAAAGKCVKVLKREIKFDNNGASIGERILCTSGFTAPGAKSNILLWTSGSYFHEISSNSSEQVLKIEKYFQ